jgi:hypothetical protein
MVVGVFETQLEGIMVDVDYGELSPDPGNGQGFELQGSHGPGSILHQGLIDGNPNRLPLANLACDQMSVQYLLNEILPHSDSFLPILIILYGISLLFKKSVSSR